MIPKPTLVCLKVQFTVGTHLIKANNATKTSVEKGTKEILARIILWPKKTTTTTKSKTSSSQNTKVIKTSRGNKKL